jgi:tetratricopeptide (TPR) repeat protein
VAVCSRHRAARGRDKRSGKLLYTGRTGPSLDDAQAARFAALRDEASKLVTPFADGQKRDLGFFEKRRLKSGISKLRDALALLPDDWSTHWTLGMSLRALQQHEDALDHFRRAYATNGTVDSASRPKARRRRASTSPT